MSLGPVPAHGSQPGDAPPTADAVEQVGHSEERTGARLSPAMAMERDSQPGEAPPAVDVVEPTRRSEEQTGAHVLHESWSEDALPTAPVRESQGEDRGDP